MKNKNYNQKGIAMVEILVAVSIMAVAFIAIMAVAQKSIYLARQGLHQSQSAFLLEEGAEAVRIVRDGAWSDISSLSTSTDYYPLFSGGTWILTQTPATIGIFSRKVTVASVYRNGSDDIAGSGTLDTGTKFVTVTISWQEGGQTLSKILSFYLSDIFS